MIDSIRSAYHLDVVNLGEAAEEDVDKHQGRLL